MEVAFAVAYYVKYAVGKGRSTWLKNVFEFLSNGDHCYHLQNVNPLVLNITTWQWPVMVSVMQPSFKFWSSSIHTGNLILVPLG